jgi:hypothetical protein
MKKELYIKPDAEVFYFRYENNILSGEGEIDPWNPKPED